MCECGIIVSCTTTDGTCYESGSDDQVEGAKEIAGILMEWIQMDMGGYGRLWMRALKK